MRVLHRINLNVAAGVENQFHEFVRHPDVRASLCNSVLIGKPIHPDLAPGIVPNVEHAISLKRWRGIKIPRHLRGALALRAGWALSKSRAEALLAWSAFAKPELTAACRRHGVPLLYREGGSGWMDVDRRYAEEFLGALGGALCNTRASMRILQLKWGYAGPAKICLGGIRPDLVPAEPAPRHLASDEIVLGTAGRLVPLKGTALALHALRELLDAGVRARLRIAGDGAEGGRLRALAQRLGIAKRVEFLGAVRDMHAFYRSLDVFVHAALREPLGNVCIEAAVHGCVVIATRVDGLAETVIDGVTGLTLAAEGDLDRYRELGGNLEDLPPQVYDPDLDALRELRCVEPRSIADTIGELVSQPARFEAMSAAAVERIRERFAFDRYVRDMIAGIHEFAGRPAAAR